MNSNSNVNSRVALITLATVTPVIASPSLTVNNKSTTSAVKSTANQQNNRTTTDNNNQPSEKDFKNATEKLNDLMQSMNTNIKFVLHSKTNTLMIQVEDSKNHRTIREISAHELLDMMARLRDSAGVLMDKKR